MLPTVSQPHAAPPTGPGGPGGPGGPAGPAAPLGPDGRPPAETTRVLSLPRGRHSAGPVRFAMSSPRRTWVSRAVLLVILIMQAVLTLRMNNTRSRTRRYVSKQGQYLTGDAGYVAAIKAGYFRVVAYNFQTTPGVDNVLARTLRADPDYRLAARLPNGNDTVAYYVWVKR